MTDFTREDMRERIISTILDAGESTMFQADAIMDELGLWEAYEKAEVFLAAWTTAGGSEARAAIELGRALRRVRGETK